MTELAQWAQFREKNLGFAAGLSTFLDSIIQIDFGKVIFQHYVKYSWTIFKETEEEEINRKI